MSNGVNEINIDIKKDFVKFRSTLVVWIKDFNVKRWGFYSWMRIYEHIVIQYILLELTNVIVN